jgi:hypothetical protein
MKHVDRRRLFKLAGAGSIVAAGAALPGVSRITSSPESNIFGFRASLGLPEPPLPNYATYVLEGTLNLANGTGLVTSRVLAGHPGDPSAIGLPGLTRVVRVATVQTEGSYINVRGVIEDRSQLQPGESPQVDFVIDRAGGVVRTTFVGRQVALALA